METIRVLQIFTIMNRGGAESMIMNYYRNIDRDKIQFDFIVHRKEKAAFDDEIESLGGKIFRLPSINPFFPNQYYEELRSFFRENSNYTIVHSHLNTFSSFPLKIAEEFKIPCRIAHAHIAIDKVDLNAFFEGKESYKELFKKVIKFHLKKKIKNYATDYFSCGKKAGEWLFGVSTDFYIMNNAIDVDQFTYNPEVAAKYCEKLGLKNKFVLGHIGRFNSQKNHEFIIRTFALLLKKNKNAVLLLIGDGQLRQKNENLAKELKINNNIVFLGARSDVPQLCQVMNVFLFPSFYEGLPVTLIEAQAAGLKVVTSDAITTEIVITDNVTQLSLGASLNTWVNTIIDLEPLSYDKKDYKEEITRNNFNIKNSVKEIEAFYLKTTY